MAKMIKKIKKYQNSGKPIAPTSDSTAYFKMQAKKATSEMSNAKTPVAMSIASNKISQADKDIARQKNKGKKGYDKNGFPIKQKSGGKTAKAKTGTKMSKMMSKMSKKK